VAVSFIIVILPAVAGKGPIGRDLRRRVDPPLLRFQRMEHADRISFQRRPVHLVSVLTGDRRPDELVLEPVDQSLSPLDIQVTRHGRSPVNS